MRSKLSSLLKRFCRDSKGTTMIIFGIALLPIIICIGMAVDYGRAIKTEGRLVSAIDAAALAAGSWPDLTDAQLEAKVNEYFDANFSSDVGELTKPLQVSRSGDVITVTAEARIETTFLHVAGINQLDVGATNEIVLNEKKIELVMVLDNTGSMSWSGKIGALKDAAELLVNILKSGEGAAANDEAVKIGLVPFAAAVNIGSDKLGKGWIDETAQSSIASEDFTAGVNVLDLYGQINNRSWNGCVRARPEPFDTSDDAPGGNANTLWLPYFAPDEPDVGWYANRYASDSGYTGSKYDYDARQRYTGKYAGLNIPGWTSDGPTFNCEIPTISPMTQIKSEIISGIESMIASGSTVIPAGLSWGWRVISPTEPYTEGAAYTDKDVIKAIILLTDGQNSVGGGLGNHNRSYYNAYGFAQSGHLGSTNGWQAESVLDAKTATLCNNIKAQGIRLYTITFQLSNGPIKDLMRSCATDTSMYYDSPSNEQLQSVFADIAKGLNDLRIAK